MPCGRDLLPLLYGLSCVSWGIERERKGRWKLKLSLVPFLSVHFSTPTFQEGGSSMQPTDGNLSNRLRILSRGGCLSGERPSRRRCWRKREPSSCRKISSCRCPSQGRHKKYRLLQSATMEDWERSKTGYPRDYCQRLVKGESLRNWDYM